MKISLYLWLAILWMALIWLLSSLPAKELPELGIIGIDKLAHFGVYFVWGMLVNLHFIKRQSSAGAFLVLYSLMFISAALDEYHQKYIPGRSVSVYDFLANALGLLGAMGIGKAMLKRSKHD